ncbi:MAG: GNAT family N-acetyltransferase [Candidatus Nanopelagicales bacterium]
MDLTIRDLRDDEHAAVADLLRTAYGAVGHFDANPAYEATVVDVTGRAAHQPVRVAERDGVLVGTYTLAPAGSEHAEVAADGEVELRYLAVSPEAQGTGVAKALVTDAEQQARVAGATGLVISVISWNTPAHRLYSGLGFVRDDVRTWRPVPEVELVVSTKAL